MDWVSKNFDVYPGYWIFQKLIKCYREYYRKSTGENIIDVVILGCFDNVCLHQLLIERNGKKYIASSDMNLISDGYDEIIPLIKKVPFYKGYIVKKSDLYGLVDIQGKEIIPCSYAKLKPTSFYLKKEENRDFVDSSAVVLFDALIPDSYKRDIFDIDGNMLFSGYIYTYLHIKEVEYGDPPADVPVGYGVTVYETWKSIKFTNDLYYECDPMFGLHCFTYHIDDLGDKYELTLTKSRSDWEDDELPDSKIFLRKPEFFFFGKSYTDDEKKCTEKVCFNSPYLSLLDLDYWDAHDKMPVDELFGLMKIKEKLLLSEINAICDLEIANKVNPEKSTENYRQYEKDIYKIRQEIEGMFSVLEELHRLNKATQ